MSKCLYCNEELTTANYCDEHIGICTKCYNSMFKVSDEFVKGLTDKIADLEAKLAEKEERINWLVEAEFNRKWAKKYVEMRRKEDPMLCLPDSDEVYEKYFELKQQLAEKDEVIANWQTMYESVVQTCHNDKEEIKRLNKRLETQENTITNLVEDNRASQEWYKKQLEEKEKENELMAKTLRMTKFIEKEINQDKISFALEQLEKVKEYVDNLDTPCVASICNEYMCDIEDYIDNQIKAIKGEK